MTNVRILIRAREATMAKSFYVTLPSNGSTGVFPDNTDGIQKQVGETDLFRRRLGSRDARMQLPAFVVADMSRE